MRGSRDHRQCGFHVQTCRQGVVHTLRSVISGWGAINTSRGEGGLSGLWKAWHLWFVCLAIYLTAVEKLWNHYIFFLNCSEYLTSRCSNAMSGFPLISPELPSGMLMTRSVWAALSSKHRGKMGRGSYEGLLPFPTLCLPSWRQRTRSLYLVVCGFCNCDKARDCSVDNNWNKKWNYLSVALPLNTPVPFDTF